MRLVAAVAFAVLGTLGVIAVTGDVVHPVVFALAAAAFFLLRNWARLHVVKKAREAEARPDVNHCPWSPNGHHYWTLIRWRRLDFACKCGVRLCEVTKEEWRQYKAERKVA